MHFTRQERACFFILLFCIVALSWMMQSHLLICRDVSWGLHETKLLLSGGTYGKDFYEPSPPMFLYLYSPPVVLARLFSVNVFLPFKIYLFILSFSSLCICYALAQKIFLPQDTTLAGLFLLTLAAIFLLLPLPLDFGQREHLLVILSMPYFLLATIRLENKTIPYLWALMIGLIAGIGFAIKPFFLIPFALIELYIIFYTRNLWAWIRIETLTIILLLACYLLFIYFFYLDYIVAIIPSAMRFYYQGYSSAWKSLFLQPSIVFCVFAVLFYMVQYRNTYRILSSILLIALFGLLLCYFLQRTTWYYHLLPAFSFAILSITLSFSLFAAYPSDKKRNYLPVIALSILLIVFLFYYVKTISTSLIFYPVAFFCFFNFLFAILFYIAQIKKNIYTIAGSLFIITSISSLCDYLVRRMPWYSYQFPIVVLLLLTFFYLFIPRNHTQPVKNHFIFASFLGMLIFAFPLYNENISYLSAIGYKDQAGTLINFIKTHAAHKPVYFFSTVLSHEFPAVDYAEAIPASRYAHLVWLPGLEKQLHENNIDNVSRAKLTHAETFFIAAIANELNTNKPILVMVDVQKNKGYLGNITFDYLKSFLQHATFQAAWKPYHYLTTVESSFYKFEIYERISYDVPIR